MSTTSEGKGRPTPKRSEAQKKRAQATAPKTRKEAAAAMREKRRTEMAQTRAAMKSGDISKLPAAERTPEKILARAIVDTRRNFAWITIPVLVPLYIINQAIYKANKELGTLTTSVMLILMIVVVVDSFRVSRLVRRTIAERLPNVTVTRGLSFYAMTRAGMPRRLRQPRSNLRVGDPLPDKV